MYNTCNKRSKVEADWLWSTLRSFAAAGCCMQHRLRNLSVYAVFRNVLMLQYSVTPFFNQYNQSWISEICLDVVLCLLIAMDV